MSVDLTATHLDFETFSRAELKKCGAYQYSVDPTTEILFLCWATGMEEPETWCPVFERAEALALGLPGHWHYGRELPAALAALVRSGRSLVAHNAQFERCIWENVVVRKHGGPRTKRAQFVCTAARCAAVGLPRSLDGAGMALDTKAKKDPEGARLVKLFCIPKKPSKKDPRDRILPSEDTFNFEKLGSYCAQDVRTERDIDALVPQLSADEQRLFTFDMLINERGLQLDVPLIKKTVVIVGALETKIVNYVKSLTKTAEYPEGLRPTQRDKFMKFFTSIGVVLENMQADYIRKFVKVNARALRDNPLARELLALRIEAGKSSTKKLAAMLHYAHPVDMRARGTFLIYGSHTGRWCLDEDTEVRVMDDQGWIGIRKIKHVRSTDKLWDGGSWVTHGGVVFSGVKEVMSYDGVRATKDHEVWLDPHTKTKLVDAFIDGKKIWRSDPWVVYALTFPNGKHYIGVSNRPMRRLRQHLGLETGKKLSNAILKYGYPAYRELRWVDGKAKALALEEAIIAKYRTVDYGYNIAKGGQCGPGFSPENQLAASLKGAARLQELLKDPDYAARHNARVSAGIAKSSAFKEANKARSVKREQDRRDRIELGLEDKDARGKKMSATIARKKAELIAQGKPPFTTAQQRSRDMRALGLLKKQTKPVPHEEKNKRVAEGMKRYMASKTPEERKQATAGMRAAVIWDDDRRDLQRKVMSKAISAYWKNKREA